MKCALYLNFYGLTINKVINVLLCREVVHHNNLLITRLDIWYCTLMSINHKFNVLPKLLCKFIMYITPYSL